ncbi:enoyl-CoA hydratase-related protein [Pusillimonas minor]|uniref:Enoyl-CoA hydratase/isomerase family protein n=1 Tax=Pusillimonas minor TaxID=2697024 RepID=A0A842HMT5_9BURK|nr:enoyl-CoA hydratase/isomerase family protein [Pusillimonas minor]
MNPPLLTETCDGVLTLTLNRPDAHNALDPELLCRLVDALDAFDTDPNLHVAILTGAGPRAFCSGGDLGSTLQLLSGRLQPKSDWDRRLLDDPRIRTLAPLRETPLSKPLIAAVNGICMAAGAEILLGTDIRLATSTATFGWLEVKHALIPFAGTLARLPRQIPYCQAMDLLLTGRTIDAPTALSLGLINQILPADEVLPEAQRIAQRIAANGPLAVREIKRVTRAAIGMPLDAGYALEDESYRTIMGSADAQEGPVAFMEKRKPEFRGQ